MMLEEITGSFVVYLAVGLLIFSAVIGLAVVSFRKRQMRLEAKLAVLSGLGFDVLEDLSRGVLERLSDLFPHLKPSSLSVRNVYIRRGARGSMYVLDGLEDSESENSLVGSDLILVVGSGLMLPAAVLTGRFFPGGRDPAWLRDMAEKAVSWVASRGGYTRVDLSDFPFLDEKLFLMVKENQSPGGLIEDHLLSDLTWLAGDDHISMLSMSGDSFALSRITYQPASESTDPLREMVDDARRILDILSEERFFQG